MSNTDFIKNIHGDCITVLNQLKSEYKNKIALTFLDPPFNQDKDYPNHNDRMPEEQYWSWMYDVCSLVFDLTIDGGSIYFMQREKNAFHVWKTLTDSGWTIQNLIIWKKKTSPVPQPYRFGKQYQVIVFATKGKKPAIFNRLRIDLPLEPNQKIPRKNGVYVTDIWDDIRELTSGFFAGNEALRASDGTRLHNQQSPIALLTRIILSSSNVGDIILDPFAGTGTTAVVAKQLMRNCITIELAKEYYEIIKNRVSVIREADKIDKLRNYYRYTENLDAIWPSERHKTKTVSIDQFF